MNIALVGYGKMGHEIEQIALSKGHKIVAVIDKDNVADFEGNAFKSADVAIEFSTPETAYDNIIACFKQGVSVVCGTTGWLEKMEEAKKLCQQYNTGFFYASNYSLGVNLFFRLNQQLAKMMAKYPQYEINMEEIHHVHKKDAPSGTAITLAEDIINIISHKTSWVNQPDSSKEQIPINSVREDSVPGTHVISYESDVDVITIRHEAKNRKGLATGAVIAAEFLAGKKGVYSMNDLLKD